MFMRKNYRRYAIAFALPLLIGLIGIFYPHEENSPKTIKPATVSTAVEPLPPASKEVSGNNPSSQPAAVNPAPVAGSGNENPFFEKEVKARLAQVADVYAEQIQYPAFSIPIADKQALRKYIPNRSIASSLALDYQDENSPSLRIKTEKRQYFTNEPIVATLRVSGLEEGAWVEAKGRLVENANVLQHVEGVEVGRQPPTYQLTFDPSDKAVSAGGELLVIGSMTIAGKHYEIGTPVTYVESIAELTRVGAAEVRGAYLYIPLHITTSNPGFHEVGANLYGSDAQPLIHLSAQQELRTSGGIIPLRAHISALRRQGHSGPYLLKDIALTRMPSPPDYTTEYGHTAKAVYEVNGFGFDQYDNEPYVDEEAQKRLQFLQQLGDVE